MATRRHGLGFHDSIVLLQGGLREVREERHRAASARKIAKSVSLGVRAAKCTKDHREFVFLVPSGTFSASSFSRFMDFWTSAVRTPNAFGWGPEHFLAATA